MQGKQIVNLRIAHAQNVKIRSKTYILITKKHYMEKLILKAILFSTILIYLSGCSAYKDVAYLQEAGTAVVFSDTEQAPIPDPFIKSGDVLLITVNANTPEAAAPFNLPLVPSGEHTKSYTVASGSNLSYGLSMQNYLVDTEGNLTFPVIGKIKAVGLTKLQLTEKIKQSIHPAFITEEPIILIRYVNFRISVLGEVLLPGSFVIDSEKISILEALALAGDMTIYGDRGRVLLVRENQGKRESVRLDIKDKNLVNSPYFYLQQGDVLYVEPNKPKARSAGISTAETLSITVVGTMISIASLVINILKK